MSGEHFLYSQNQELSYIAELALHKEVFSFTS